MATMNKAKNQLLTPSQMFFIVYGSMTGIGVLSLPKSLVEISQQDAWISSIVGAIYPLYICLIVIYISKKYPNDNILFLSKKYFGNFLGKIFNLLFLILFVLTTVSVISGYTNIVKVYAAEFLSSLKLIIIITVVSMYTAYKGISLIGKISEIIFYITLPLIIIPLFSLGKSSILNIFPILGSGITNILKGSIETMYSYLGVEFLLLTYHYVNDKNKIKSFLLTGVFLTMVTYVWIMFITIYYFGIDVTSKSLWPFLSAAEIIDIPIINNFRYLFMLSWSFILLKSIAIYYFGVVYILKDFIKKINVKKVYLFIYPILVFLSMFFTNEITRRNFLSKVTPVMVIFSLIYASSVALLIRIKG
ncbi:GerAB/ArcD/ProY family transporter [Clostridium aestuarii]|uniref:GerAB/ArcD/ProY family transporter n=1 Tax=Clostridium aestuarii TaxID=338193 RepID=A0ABT4CW93_9CLOT|nr:GerAB/ArcD/ProY family transporter [Clostridium aestuarii]MCY6483087.1 GerAB/ArcD/ProY family transporter [Clostridium aestuarii]